MIWIIIAFAIFLMGFNEMKRFGFRIYLVVLSLFFFWMMTRASTSVTAQEPQPSSPSPIPPSGAYITVITEEPQINVRLGPSSSVYPVVGILPRGATAPALGRSAGGDWIQIEYVGAPNNLGWVYSPLVQVSNGILQIVEPPPTPVPPATSTIDPTLAAQFTIFPTNTRLSTFTPPPSLIPRIYTPISAPGGSESLPMAAIIFSLGGVGVASFLGSLVFRRR